jgi:hypothetical protein
MLPGLLLNNHPNEIYSDRKKRGGGSRKRLANRTALRPISPAFNAHGTTNRWLHGRDQGSRCARHFPNTHETLVSNPRISPFARQFEIVGAKDNTKWKENRRRSSASIE